MNWFVLKLMKMFHSVRTKPKKIGKLELNYKKKLLPEALFNTISSSLVKIKLCYNVFSCGFYNYVEPMLTRRMALFAHFHYVKYHRYGRYIRWFQGLNQFSIKPSNKWFCNQLSKDMRYFACIIASIHKTLWLFS